MAMLPLLLALLLATASRGDDQPVTKNIEAIFKGRCLEFLAFKQLLTQDKIPEACNNLYNEFKKAITDESGNAPYARLIDTMMNLSTQPIAAPKGKTLFWSGTGPHGATQDVVHRFTKINNKYVTLEQTLLGAILNGLAWCEPKQQNCKSISRASPYWNAASKAFAQAATGDITVFLAPALDIKSNKMLAYRQNSLFATDELPHLNKESNGKITILLAWNNPAEKGCDSEDIKKLKADIKKRYPKRPPVQCIDDNSQIRLLLCATGYFNPRICSLSIVAATQPPNRVSKKRHAREEALGPADQGHLALSSQPPHAIQLTALQAVLLVAAAVCIGATYGLVHKGVRRLISQVASHSEHADRGDAIQAEPLLQRGDSNVRTATPAEIYIV